MRRGRDQFHRYKSFIHFLVAGVRLLPNRWRRFFLDFVKDVHGKKGLLFRYVLLKSLAKECGDNVAIYPYVIILGVENLRVGSNVSFHPFSYVDATGEVSIGDDVSIAHGSTIMSTEHHFENLEIPIRDQGSYKAAVVIENDVWVAAGCKILAGSTMRNGSILAAGAVLKAEVPAKAIFAGVPARLLKYRGMRKSKEGDG